MKKIIISLLFVFLSTLASAQSEKVAIIKNILRLQISSSINPATLNYIQSNIARAQKENSDAILIELNTPGGLVSTTKEILTSIGKSDIPFFIWITPEGASATSAGAIISSGAHLLFMSEGTNIGAATPIQLTSEMEKDVKAKAQNDLIALVKSLCETRGRNAELFASMIDKAQSFTSKTALDKKIIEGIVNNDQELIEKINKKEIILHGEKVLLKTNESTTIVNAQMDLGQRLLNIFANPNLAYILFLLGAALLYFEFQAPGGFIAGSLGALCLILAAISFQVLPLNFGALGLLVFSFILFILEAFIVSYGLLSLAGLASLVMGSLFLFRTEEGHVEISTAIIISSVAAVALFLAFVAFVFIKDMKKIGQKTFNKMIGKEALIISLIEEYQGEYIYQVKVSGEIWNALSKTPREIGSHVKVSAQEGMRLIL